MAVVSAVFGSVIVTVPGPEDIDQVSMTSSRGPSLSVTVPLSAKVGVKDVVISSVEIDMAGGLFGAAVPVVPGTPNGKSAFVQSTTRLS